MSDSESNQTVSSVPSSVSNSNLQGKRRRKETASPSKVVKKAWHSAREEKKTNLSLKKFALALNVPEAKEWFDNKGGVLMRQEKEERITNRGAVIRATALASKSSNKKG